MERLIRVLEESRKNVYSKGLLAFHPLFKEIFDEMLDSTCRDCRDKIKERYNEYLKDVRNTRWELKKAALKIDVPVHNHPDIHNLIKIFNEVTWRENKHIECYVNFKGNLRF